MDLSSEFLYRIDRLIRTFSYDETGDDSVDITISDRLDNYIIAGRYGTGLDFSYKNCRHGFTIFTTVLQAANEVTMELLENDVHREVTDKSATDVRESKGKSQPIVSDYYTMMV